MITFCKKIRCFKDKLRHKLRMSSWVNVLSRAGVEESKVVIKGKVIKRLECIPPMK